MNEATLLRADLNFDPKRRGFPWLFEALPIYPEKPSLEVCTPEPIRVPYPQQEPAVMKRRTTRALRKDFYEAQAAQRRKSLFLLPVLVLFYVLSLGLIIWVLWALVGGLVTGRLIPSGPTSLKLFFLDIGIALTLAFVQYIDARQNGARFIIRRLQAEPPDPRDRYHVMFSNTLDEMRIAAGLPKVRAAVLPTFAINSMALIEPDATPVILVTEGLLAAYTRDELQAVIAHELAHVLRGDAVYITLVCSLVNFFERIRESLEPEESPPPGWGTGQSSRGGAPLLYAALTISTLLMHGVSTLISRQRELLADAVAVELTRNPQALARAVYKAHLRNSFVGDFNIAYSPLLIVPPRSSGITDGFFSRLFNTHPPLMRRIRILAEMASARPAKIIQDVWDTQKRREKARVILHAAEETRQPETPATERDTSSEKPGKVWMLRNPQGEWLGPWSVEELTAQEAFTPTSRVLNTQEHLEAPALDFPQIRMALHGRHRKSRPGPSKKKHVSALPNAAQGELLRGSAGQSLPRLWGEARRCPDHGQDRRQERSRLLRLVEKESRKVRERFSGKPGLSEKNPCR